MDFEKIKGWVNEDLKDWLKINYKIDLQNIKYSDNIEISFTLYFNGFKREITFDEEDLKEVEIGFEEVKELNIRNISQIYSISKKVCIALIDSAEKINFEKNKYNFISSTDKKIEAIFSSNPKLSFLPKLISSGYNLNFDKDLFLDTTGSNDFLSFFRLYYLECSYNEEFNSEELTQQILSMFFSIGIYLEVNFFPLGISILEDSEINSYQKNIYVEESGEFKKIDLSLINLNLDALIYYFSALKNNDFRFKFLEFYHVLEYYFEEISLINIRSRILDAIKNPIYIREKEKLVELTKNIKNEISNKMDSDYREPSMLKKIIEIYMGSNEFLALKSNKFILDKIDLGYNHRKQPSVNKLCFENCKLEEISTRIYTIRNAIAHSKEEGNWNLQINSSEIDMMKKDIILMEDICKFLIIHFSK
jgi:hypothetical protein